MILRNNTTFSKNSLKKDLGEDTEIHNIGENNIMFGMKIDYNGANLLNDESYFTYTLNQVSQVYAQSGSSDTTQRTKTAIPSRSWTFSSFEGMTQTNYKRLGINEYFCPSTKNFTIAANYYAPRYDYIEIKVYRCNPSSSKVTWKPNISDVMKQTQLAFMVSNNYLDFNNYTDPIHEYLDDRFFWDLAPGLRKKIDIFVKNNGAELIDDFIQLTQKNSFSFYEVSTMRESVVIEETDLQIVSVFFRLGSYFDNYSRRIYSLGDLLGQVGGLYSSILIIGALFVGIFSERLFVSSILRKIYQIDKIRDDEIWKAYANSKGKISTQQIPLKFEHGKIICIIKSSIDIK